MHHSLLFKRLSFYMLLYGLFTNLIHCNGCNGSVAQPTVQANEIEEEEDPIKIEDLNPETLQKLQEGSKDQLAELEKEEEEKKEKEEEKEKNQGEAPDKDVKPKEADPEPESRSHTAQEPTAPPDDTLYNQSAPPPYYKTKKSRLEKLKFWSEFWLRKVMKYERYNLNDLTRELKNKRAKNYERQRKLSSTIDLSDQTRKEIRQQIRNTTKKIAYFEKRIQKLEQGLEIPPPPYNHLYPNL